MTRQTLDAVFSPASIALIGASNRPGSLGKVLAANLLESGFAGPVMAVNPHEAAIRSTLAYPSVEALPMAPELAVIAIPAAQTPDAVRSLGKIGCKAAVVISAGFEPGENGGAEHAKALVEAAKAAGVRLIGPNCLGVLNPKVGLNASFAHLAPAPGDIALISQSGAVASAAMDWAATRGLGFSKVATVGDALDLGVAELLEYLAVDPDTRAILLYLESVADARRFMSAAGFAAQSKPVIAIKGGRSASGAKAAYSHTGAMAGGDLVFSAALRRAGVVQVETLRELFDTALLLKSERHAPGRRLAILTNGGGAGVLATDALDKLGGHLAELSPATVAAISAIASPNWSHRNPADILGDAPPPTYTGALAALIADPGVDAVLVMNCPTALVASADAARAVVAGASADRSGKTIFTCWLGGAEAEHGRAVLSAADLPTYDTPGDAVDAFMQLANRTEVQAMLLATPEPPPPPPDLATARALVAAALAEGRRALTAAQTMRLLRAFQVPAIDIRLAADPIEAGRAAGEIGGPVALKILSDAISHKTDVGGVVLGLQPDRVRAEAEAMLARVKAARPEAAIDGFMIEPMVDRSSRMELIAGIGRDPVFGPVILFGQGGVAAEAIGDRAVGLPPLDTVLAGDMIAHTRVARLLGPLRGGPGQNVEAVAQTLVALSRIAVEVPEIAELDINPLMVSPDGALAVDARVRLDPVGVRPAIAPYPADLVRLLEVGDLRLTLRPVRADDAPRLEALVARCTPTDVFFRFGAGMRALPPELARRLAHIDYDRHMALAAEDAAGDLIGVARLARDPGGESGEFAVLVRSDSHGRHIGEALMRALLDYAQGAGLTLVWGETDVDNGAMIDLARHLGFDIRIEAGVVRLTKRLVPTP